MAGPDIRTAHLAGRVAARVEKHRFWPVQTDRTGVSLLQPLILLTDIFRRSFGPFRRRENVDLFEDFGAAAALPPSAAAACACVAMCAGLELDVGRSFFAKSATRQLFLVRGF